MTDKTEGFFRHMQAKLLVNYCQEAAIDCLTEAKSKDDIRSKVERILENIGLEYNYETMMKVHSKAIASYFPGNSNNSQGHGHQRFPEPSPPASQSSPFSKHEGPANGGDSPLCLPLTTRSQRERPGTVPETIFVLTPAGIQLLTMKKSNSPNCFICAEAVRRFASNNGHNNLLCQEPVNSFSEVHDDALNRMFTPQSRVKLTYARCDPSDQRSNEEWFFVVDNLTSADVLIGNERLIQVPPVEG